MLSLWVVEDRNSFVGEECVLSVVEHEDRKLVHERLGLQMEVAKHGVSMPASEHAKEVEVDLRTEQGHGASSAKRLGGDVFCVEAGCVVVNFG